MLNWNTGFSLIINIIVVVVLVLPLLLLLFLLLYWLLKFVNNCYVKLVKIVLYNLLL